MTAVLGHSLTLKVVSYLPPAKNIKLMKTKIQKFYLTIFNLIILLSAHPALAVTKAKSSRNRLKDIVSEAEYPQVEITPQEIVTNIIIYALGFVGILFLAMIIYSGLQWILAGGNEEVITKAKDRLKNAVIGFVVIGVAYAITYFIKEILESSI